MKAMIVGASGSLGGELVAACEVRGFEVHGTRLNAQVEDFTRLDVRNPRAVDWAVSRVKPDVLLVAAPHAGVAPDGVRHAAAAAARHAGAMVWFSAGDVFGDCDWARREDDPAAPVDDAGRDLAAAEDAVRELLPDRHLIVRTNGVYGPTADGEDFAARVVRSLTLGAPFTADDAAVTQPAFAPDVAAVAMELLDAGHRGTVHAVGPDRMTPFTFARLIAHLWGFDADLVRQSDETGGPRVWLDRFKLRGLLGPKALRSPGEGLRAVRDRNAGTCLPFVRAA